MGNPINANINHTIAVTFFNSRAIAEDGNITPALITREITKPNFQAARKFIDDTEAKAANTPTIALIAIDVIVDGVVAWTKDYTR